MRRDEIQRSVNSVAASVATDTDDDIVDDDDNDNDDNDYDDDDV